MYAFIIILRLNESYKLNDNQPDERSAATLFNNINKYINEKKQSDKPER